MTSEDISRFLFQPHKRYASVRMQQGRVLLDSDWNEYESLEREDARHTLIDIVCAKGTSNKGFRIGKPDDAEVTLPGNNSPPQGETSIQTYNFPIAQGSFYLGGLRFEAGSGDSPETFLQQSDWLQIDLNADSLPPLPTNLEPGKVRYDLVYLRGWEQCVTAVEDSELRERALGGPDSSVRVRRMRRVAVLADVPDACAEAFAKLRQTLITHTAPDGTETVVHRFDDRTCELQSGTRLTLSFDPEGITEDPCKPTVTSGYLGADNQTIRIQFTAANRFIWGYDNAAPLYRVQVGSDRQKIEFLTLPRDQEAQPLAGQAVEIIPWGALLPNQEKVAEFQGQLFTVSGSYDPTDNSIMLAEAIPEAWVNWLATHQEYWSDRDPSDRQHYFYLRLWTGGSGEANTPDWSFTPGVSVSLPGTGLQVTFTQVGIPGDFWVIAARPNTPDVVVPWELLTAAPPAGSKTCFAPLALIRWTVDNNNKLQGSVQDCRERFQPLCEVQGCCTVTVGDGNSSHGLFNSIEDAIAFLPPQGGKICLLPGRHRTNARLENRQNIRITGCGVHTIVQPRPEQVTEPIFQIQSCQTIQLDQMTLVAHAGTGIQVLDPPNTPQPSRTIHILENHIVAGIHAIEIRVNNEQAGNNDIWIAHNQLSILDKEIGRTIVFVLADDVLIERNRLVVVPPPNPDDPNDPRRPEDFPDDVFDPCVDPQILYTPRFPLYRWVAQTLQYIAKIAFVIPIPYKAQGGIQIGGGSEQVTITQNQIIGGAGNGITLGHLPVLNSTDTNGTSIDISQHPFIATLPNQEVQSILRQGFDSTLYDLTIEQNTIQAMGLSGMGVVMFLDVQAIRRMVRVETLTVQGNIITNCLRQPPNQVPEPLVRNVGFGGISLAACEAVRISENRIENNGLNHITPTCGIFILLAENVEIRDNHILNNGPFESNLNQPAQRGIRGGIVMACLSYRVVLPGTEDSQALPLNLGIGDTVAAHIHGNTVSQPLSQALIILAIGPLSITNNVFASQDVDLRANPFAVFSGAVLIFNLGLPIQEVLGGIGNLLLSTQNQRKRTPPQDGNLQSGTDAVAIEPATVLGILFWPSGNVLFNNNQTVFDLREVNGRTAAVDGAFSSQFIFSLDDVSFNGNQSDCNFLLDLLITNIFVLGFSVRVSNNRLKEGFLAFLSIFSLGLMNITSYNQCSHCIYAKESSGFENNQILYPGSGFILSDIINNFCDFITFILDSLFGDRE